MLGFKAGTIKCYLAGIHFFYKIIFGSDCLVFSSHHISLLIKGIRRSEPAIPDRRLPITINILESCIQELKHGFISTNSDQTLIAMFLLAYFGLLRCSEFTTRGVSFNPQINPRVCDLQILNADTIRYFIKQSKTDQSKKGHSVFIFNIASPLLPFQTLAHYLAYRSSIASPSEPLFATDDGKPVTRYWFQAQLKSIITRVGIPADRYSTHSFRIGAATTAANNGLSDLALKTLGRWSSDAYNTYIRSNISDLRKSQQALSY